MYIPKANGKLRPLGILNISDRASQAIIKNALEPHWEARFEASSYGFRPGRSCHDAIWHCWHRLRSGSPHQWVLDADVSAAFDNISHSFILDRIGLIPGRELIKRWLRAGYVEKEFFHATTTGVQQGGVISPVIANIALDGLEELLGSTYGFIRYADDFVATARSKEQLDALKPKIELWLAERGLALNLEKTRIVNVNDGFNFLGFHIRRFHGKCLTKPQKEKVLDFLKRIREWLHAHKAVSAETVIRSLNPKLIGWANYYRHAVSSRTYSYVDSQVWKAIWHWCLQRHPRKSKQWVKRRYFKDHHGRDWTFFANATTNDDVRTLVLTRLSDIKIRRHVKVRGAASPDDPTLREYWQQRRDRRTE